MLMAAYASALVIAATEPIFAVIGKPPWRDPSWDACVLLVSIPVMTLATLLLVIHSRRTPDAGERARARLLLSSFALGTTLGATELVSNLSPSVPSLSGIGMLVATVPLVLVTTRFRLLEQPASVWMVSNVFLAAALAVAVGTLVFHVFPRAASFVIAGALMGLVVVVVARTAIADSAARRERAASLAALGRLSAQMAHDVKNPLAALRGAAQVLQVDLEQPSSTLDRKELVALMLSQVDRIGRLLETYGRLATTEPLCSEVDVNQVVGEIIAAQSLDDRRPQLQADLDERLQHLWVDRDMLQSIVENLVRNAIKATVTGGSITVRTKLVDEFAPKVVVEVEDTGTGMDARTQERAFDDFFTTHAEGSGLGLSFVRRMAHAHGGKVTLSSQIGRGTLVRVVLPINSPAGSPVRSPVSSPIHRPVRSGDHAR
ncbi:MAG: hypothetical protein NVSMB1_19570 [Polyangiales bacterium]